MGVRNLKFNTEGPISLYFTSDNIYANVTLSLSLHTKRDVIVLPFQYIIPLSNRPTVNVFKITKC